LGGLIRTKENDVGRPMFVEYDDAAEEGANGWQSLMRIAGDLPDES